MTNENEPNDDQIEGKAKDLKGKVKEEVGELVGNDEMRDEGQAEQLEGKVQKTWGDAQEEAKKNLS